MSDSTARCGRRAFLAGSATAVAVAWGSRGTAETAVTRPNILHILADDLGWGDLGCYGHPDLKTPHLDRLAREGTQFLQYYVNSPICSPSRAAVLTGQYPARNRIHTQFSGIAGGEEGSLGLPPFLDPSLPTLPRILQHQGYDTGFIGKWHLSGVPDAPGPDAYGYGYSRPLDTYATRAEFETRSAGYMVDDAIEYLRQPRTRPFFLSLCTLLPHAPLLPTKDQMAPYHRLGPGMDIPYPGAMQVYYAAVSGLDAQLGRLFKQLDKQGLAENTLVVFSSDNGPEDLSVPRASYSAAGSAGPFRGRKRSLYEGGIRVPLLVRWPGKVPAGRVNGDAIVSGVDLLPSLCAAAGATLPAEVAWDGENVLPTWQGEPQGRRKPLLWETRFRTVGPAINRSPRLAIREGQFKLLMNPDGSRIELYDIPNDPTETRNLSTEKPELAAELAKRLLDWHATLPEGPVEPEAGSNRYPWPGNGKS